MRVDAGGWFTLAGLAMQIVGLGWAAYGLTDRARRHGWRGRRVHRALSWVYRHTIGRKRPALEPDPPYEPGAPNGLFMGPSTTDRGTPSAQATVESRLAELERRGVGVQGDIHKLAEFVRLLRIELTDERTRLLRPINEEIGAINRRIHRLAVGELRGAVWGIALSAAGVAFTLVGYCVDNDWFGAS